MKKTFNLLFVIIAAMVTFAGCAKQEIDAPADQTKTVQFIAESIETKTAFGTPDGTTYPTLWTANDENVKLSLNLATPEDVEVTPSDDFTTARFEINIEDDASGSYVFYSLSPASACNSFNASSKYLSANIPTSQTPLENSVDEAAQILYAISDTYETMPSSVPLNFKHFTAYGKLSFSNLTLGGAVVTSVAITSSVDFAGRWNYNVESKTITENSGAGTITLNTSETSELWFACAPVDMDGQTLTFTVNTDKGPLSKTVTLSGKKFEAGKIAAMTVDMSGVEFAESKVYELVTDVTALTEESKVIIVASESDFALSTTQNGNNRGQAAVTKSEGVIKDPGEGVQVLTIEAGTVAGTYAFNTGSGYLYAASSSSNHLRTQDTNNANGSWSIKIEDGVATIVAKGVNTRNTMQHNLSHSIFACYGSASQGALSIYKLQGSGTVLENYLNVSTESIEVEAGATSTSFTVSSDLTWTATSGNAEITIDGATVNVDFEANTVNEEKTYTVVVSADGAESKTVTITQAAYVDPNVIEKLTVAEFLEKGTSDEVWYELTGIVSGIYNTTYGNFYLNNGEESVLVYGLTSTKVDSNDKSFASLNIKDGDELTLIGTRSDYQGTAQVGGPAYYVSHVSCCADPTITCTDNTVTIEAEIGATIYYTTDGTDPTTSSTQYSSSFAITKTINVKAIAVKEGMLQSVIVSNTCVYVNPDVTLLIATGTDLSASTSYQVLESGKSIQYKNSAANDYSNPVRIYKNNTFTVSGTTDKVKMFKLVFTCNSTSYADAMKNGTFPDGVEVSIEGSVVTVISSEGISSFEYVASSAQVRVSKIEVSYTE